MWSFQPGQWCGGGVNQEDDRSVQEREQRADQEEPDQTGKLDLSNRLGNEANGSVNQSSYYDGVDDGTVEPRNVRVLMIAQGSP